MNVIGKAPIDIKTNDVLYIDLDEPTYSSRRFISVVRNNKIIWERPSMQ